MQVDGEIQEEKYKLYNDAVGAAIDEMRRCEECVILIVSPRFLVERKEVIPPPVVPPPITPPPTEEPVAYYSTTMDDGELVYPRLLEGAVLPPHDVFVKWVGDGISRVQSYCCKPTGGQHSEKDISQVEDTLFVLKLRRHAGEERRLELYSDVWVDDEPHQSIYTFFNVEHTAVPPPIDPVTLITWDAPTERVDNTELKSDEIGGYVVKLSSIESNSSHTIFNLPASQTSIEIDVDNLKLHKAEWEVKISAFDTTPSRECPSENATPYSCGGPLRSDFSNAVTFVVE